MSDPGAFITSAFVNSSQPSIFQVIAQESLITTLHPAFNHIIKVLSNSSPSSLGFLDKWKDEFFLLANSALQLHYLQLHGASFSEKFYGLERVATSSSSSGLRPSYLCVVLFPYIKLKMDKLFENCRESQADGSMHRVEILNKIRSIFVSVFPFFHLTWDVLNLSILLSFTLQKTKYHSILAFLAGINLVYVSPERAKQKMEQQNKIIEGSQGLKRIALTSVAGAAGAINFGLEIGSFFLQFLDWWYNREREELSKHTEEIPQPPPQIEGLPKDKELCPICLCPRRGSTVLSTSGVVFCYVCIVHQLRKHKKCPVTNQPSDEAHLVRIYSPGKQNNNTS